MGTARHIATLLRNYNCVIIPRFGGFVANYQSARIHPVQHSMEPPAKSIAFNKNLSNNDGLLINHIAKVEGISFEKAEQNVNEFIAECESALANREVVILPKVGKLYFDIEQNLQFVRDKTSNHLLESYGLNTIQYPPINRRPVTPAPTATAPAPATTRTPEPAPKVPLVKDIKSRKPKEARKKRRTLSAATYYMSIIILLLASAVYQWVSYDLTFNEMKNFRMELSDVVSMFSFKNMIKETSQPKKKATSSVENTSVKGPSEKKDEVNPPAEDEVEPKEELPEAVTDEPDRVEEVPATIKKNELVSGSYYIILGSFQDERNAQKLLNKLLASGLSGELVRSEKGNYRVAMGTYNSKPNAREAIVSFKEAYPGAWILSL